MNAHFIKYTLNFKRPAGTSRGVLHTKDTFFIVIENDDRKGIGEVNLFKGLSSDDRPDFEEKLQWVCDNIGLKPVEMHAHLMDWPAIRFGYEMALRSYQSSNPFELFPSAFTIGEDHIPINGLVWMGDFEFMKEQLEEKLDQGFDCVKLKIGAIDFDKEISLLELVRSRFRESEITIRVDANGAFYPEDAPQKLEKLAQLGIHSIEQPIKQGQYAEMAHLVKQTPIPIALDEELIGVNQREDKIALLQRIKPQYIILKPALVGGFESCREWIDIATGMNIGWWITSALESNIGLNAIAQFTYTLGNRMPQGLGTGGLFTNNIDAPPFIKNGQLHCNVNGKWDTDALNF